MTYSMPQSFENEFREEIVKRLKKARKGRPTNWVISVADGFCEYSYPVMLSSAYSVDTLSKKIFGALKKKRAMPKLRVERDALFKIAAISDGKVREIAMDALGYDA